MGDYLDLVPVSSHCRENPYRCRSNATAVALPLLVHDASAISSAFITKFRMLAGRTVLLVVKKSRILELLAFDE